MNFMKIMEGVTEMVGAVERFDLICPNCKHAGMKQAGGLNKFSKMGHWKCLCPKNNSTICGCMYGHKRR